MKLRKIQKGPLNAPDRLGQWALCGQILFKSPINTFKVSMHSWDQIVAVQRNSNPAWNLP